jgi:hypothetical protein
MKRHIRFACCTNKTRAHTHNMKYFFPTVTLLHKTSHCYVIRTLSVLLVFITLLIATYAHQQKEGKHFRFSKATGFALTHLT